MKYNYQLILLLIWLVCGGVLFMVSCSKTDSPTITPTPTPSPTPLPGGKWTSLSNFEGGNITDAVVFTVDKKAYLIGGYRGKYNTASRQNEFVTLKTVWEFNSQTQGWTQKKDFPGKARADAMGFSIDGKGYMVGGAIDWDYTGVLKEVWEYTPETDTWVQKKEAPFEARASGIEGVANGKGYVGLGVNEASKYFNDVYEYNPKTDSWLPKAVFIGGNRVNTVSVSANGKVYAGLGFFTPATGSSALYNDLYEYDPATNVWTRLRQNLPQSTKNTTFKGGRDSAIGTALNGKLYVGGGEMDFSSSNGFGPSNDFFEYNIDKGEWTEQNLQPIGNSGAVVFALNNAIYVVGGRGVGWRVLENGLYKDVYSFTP